MGAGVEDDDWAAPVERGARNSIAGCRVFAKKRRGERKSKERKRKRSKDSPESDASGAGSVDAVT